MSALVLAPIAVAAIYYGSFWYLLFLALATVGMSVEWCRTSFQKNVSSYILLVSIWLLVALYFAFDDFVEVAVLGAAFASLGILGLTWFQKEEREWRGGFLGPVYIGIPVISLLEIRGTDDAGMYWTLSLFLIVWATDIGAYFVGRGIGGPKIATAISPNKTWAGLIGGMLCAALTAILVNRYLLDLDVQPLILAFVGTGLAILAQVGDFFESGWKRYFDIKDASNLIPGHGGVLDRLDGVLFVAPALYILKMCAGS
ncbi:MAG: phosphatidate cytidylyltransferase [Sneathiella sp.]|nr:phosphatidate cytidylyltransferase [Sneathiella sp.]